jgi:precorrin-3B C17-methyltransferase
VVGYNRYIDLLDDMLGDRRVISAGMGREKERCRRALHAARDGNCVSLVSSGDPGVYGMAGLALRIAEAEEMDVSLEIVPGVTAASAVAAKLGAPLMLDYACISLSDLLVPWEQIRERLEAVAAADMVTVLYNPRSKRRVKQLSDAARIFRQYRPDSTPVGIGTAVGTDDEKIVVSDLGSFLDEEINMRSTVIIGNGSTRRAGDWLVNPRGYRI